ncbi:MAG TPA: hypothetical protein VMH89_02450 [Candidatus Acidoferrum sp.]|nr:hypothetical protein [Candidatus Acidoferrum sp.]
MATNPIVALRAKDRRFYLSLAILIAAVVFAGFARTFYLNGYFARLHLPVLFVVHGIVFSSWIVLLVAQSALISAKRVRVHRRLGYVGIALVVVMVVLGLMMAIRSAQRGFTPPGAPPPLSFMVINFTDMVIFPAFVGSAIWFRNRPEIHKRLMIVATISILAPATARIVLLFSFNAILFKAYGISLAVLLCCMLYDYVTHRKVHPAYIWGGLILLISVPLRLYIGGTAAWLSFAHWITGT